MTDSHFQQQETTAAIPAGTSAEEGSAWGTLSEDDVLTPLFGPSDPLYPAEEPEAIVNPFDVMELVRQGQWSSALTSLAPAFRAEALPLPKEGRLLDLACGVGDFLMHLSALHPTCKLVGIDASPDLLRYVRARAKGEGRDNVMLLAHNLFEPLPSDLIPFHWISGRFLGSLLTRRQYLDLLSRARRHLFGAGRIHLLECREGYSSSAACGRLRSLHLDALRTCGFFEQDVLSRSSSQTRCSLEALLTEAGYTEVSSQRVYLPLDHPRCLNYLRMNNHQLISFLLRVGVLSPQVGKRLACSTQEELCSGSLRGYYLIEEARGTSPMRLQHTGAALAGMVPDQQGEVQ